MANTDCRDLLMIEVPQGDTSFLVVSDELLRLGTLFNSRVLLLQLCDRIILHSMMRAQLLRQSLIRRLEHIDKVLSF